MSSNFEQTPETAIELTNVSKVYQTGNLIPGIRDYLRSPTKNLRSFLTDYRQSREFHALKDVNLTVPKGQVLGLIGPNGAGKTTTLKLLAKITAPTAGRIHCRGRVSALIEVGAGFNKELTGRENIYLGGAIVGLSTKRIKSRFDEIVEFSGLERFIDTPVKRYSSGMYVRLGFSLAVALDPEILLVDEILSVGDGAFRAKSLDKMLSFARDRGVTVVFISHNMRAVQSICERVIWLREGRIEADGPAAGVIEEYHEFLSTSETRSDEPKHEGSRNTEALVITKVLLLDSEGNACRDFETGDPLRVRLYYRARQPIHRPYVTISLFNKVDHIYMASHLLDDQRPEFLEGEGYIEAAFERLDLMPGRYQPVAVIQREDGFSPLIQDLYLPSFNIATAPEKYGWTSSHAPRVIANTNCAFTPVRWRYGSGDNG